MNCNMQVLETKSFSSFLVSNENVLRLQTISSSRPEGDFKVNNLRRRGQTLCEHPDAGAARKSHIEQTVRDTEEQWRTMLQAAKEVEAAAGAELTQRTERRQSEVSDCH